MTAPKSNKRGRAALVVVLCLLALCLAAGGTVYGLLSRLRGQDTVLVNSQHHQAADRIAPELEIAALSEDGIVEALEKPDARFCLGVQWHPEWLSDADPAMQGLFDAFVNACSK